MKLSHYARQQGISYRTAFRWWKAGLVPGSQTATGTMIVTDHEAEARSPRKVAIYARVSSEAVWQDPRMPTLWKAGRIVGWIEALCGNSPQTFRSLTTEEPERRTVS
ncbi:hypothetical protein [Thermogemmatispora sp.]|uniref:hypothetical protein n=1 Tax=Thermogemmatispora sp. TaxID=1968838 RepID=UPI0035E3F95F